MKLNALADKIERYFKEKRFDKKHHLGLGDIRLTIGQQNEIVKMVNGGGMDKISVKHRDKVKITVNEDDLIDIHNILEKIIFPEAPYSRDQLQFAKNTIEAMIKNGHRIKKILSRYTQHTLQRKAPKRQI